MKNKRYLIATIIVSTLAVSLNFFIILHSCLNGDVSSQASGPVVELLKSFINLFHAETIIDSNIGTFAHVVRKLVGHFGLFLVDGVFTSWSIYLASAYIKKYKQWYGLIFSISLSCTLQIRMFSSKAKYMSASTDNTRLCRRNMLGRWRFLKRFF